MPIMVIHQIQPVKSHEKPPINPPKINQIIFPKNVIISLLSMLNSINKSIYSIIMVECS